MATEQTLRRIQPISTQLPEILKRHQRDFVAEWTKLLADAGSDMRMSEDELEMQATEFIRLIQECARDGIADIGEPPWSPMRDFLDGISRSRALQGFTSSQTASFLFSFKQPLFARLNTQFAKDPENLARETWTATMLLDSLGLYTVRSYQKSREDIIARQQEELLELSTPVVKLWDGVLALPMIGTLDSSRTQVVMESLLQKIVETGSELAIIDITGVPTVDTLVAQHLLKTVTAIRLMGADCIISGIRPQIAQTIVHLGVDLEGVTTKATLADALALALKQTGFVVSRTTQR